MLTPIRPTPGPTRVPEKSKTIPFVVAASVLSLCGAAIVAAFNLGKHLEVNWVVALFQFLVTVCLVVFAVGLVVIIGVVVFQSVTERIAALSRDHKATLVQVRKRTPAFVVAAGLLAQIVIAIADKTFGDDSLAVVSVAIVLVLLFWCANELMVRESKYSHFVGWGLWIAGVGFLPTAIALHAGLDWVALWQKFRGFPVGYQLTLPLGFIVAATVPFATTTD